MVFVAGMVGWDAECQFQTDDFVGQVRQALQNIVAVLQAGDARPEHIVRMTWYVTDKREYVSRLREIGAVFREVIGSFNAAMTAVEVSALDRRPGQGRDRGDRGGSGVMLPTPVAPSALPLKGAPPAARQSRIRGSRLLALVHA